MAEGTKLGILLTTSPEQQDMHTVVRICEAAIASGKEVHLFMMCDGVYGSQCSALTDLIPKGVNIAQCHHNAEERHIEEDKLPVKSASQYIFSGIISDVDRLLTFC
jgi:sulfur relay (sulfurtransferase) complex TusBCD TusD component (DsrE family)